MPKVKISLPKSVALKIKKGDKVKKNDVLAVGQEEGSLKTIPLAALLQISPKLISRFLQKKIGSKVLEGEKLALKKSALGLSAKVVFSPISGILEFLDEKIGEIGIREKGNSFDIVSFFDALILDIDKDFIEVEVSGNIFTAKRGEGETVEGELSNVSFENKIALIQNLDRMALARALGLGSSAFISPQINEDYLSNILSRGFKFSFLEVDEDTFKSLKEHMGKNARLMPKEKLVIIL